MDARGYFDQVVGALESLLEGGEAFTSSFSAEDSDFVRFNRSRIRQAGSVLQRGLSIDLIEGRRHASGAVSLSGDLPEDRARLSRMVRDLREQRGHLPEDPHLLYSTDGRSTDRRTENRLGETEQALADIRTSGQGRDLVGIYASGGIHAGFASSFGQRNWYSNWSFNLDWSLYHERDKAVKSAYAGFAWEPAEFRRKAEWAVEQLKVLTSPPRSIRPGKYRAYLAPAALYDLMGLLAWGGFGLKAHRTKQTPFLRMIEGGARLHPSLRILENTAEGTAPDFQEAGFLRPERVVLIDGGQAAGCLVSPRSSKEYGVPTNGASADEAPLSVDVAAGEVPEGEVLERLGTGIYVNNLWYLNYSDRAACRTTGMTRFATFWVENGRIQAPLEVMRFDETLYRMLGENLAGLTSEREMIFDSSTYGGRSTQTGRLPGALVEDFTLTL